MLDRLATLHAWFLRRNALRNFTVVCRLLLAAGFIQPGMIKVLGIPFSQISTESPIGYFFDAFHSVGPWYAFVGGAQVLAGLLLLVPPLATLGALLYLPIITNIFIITLSMDFRGTPVIVGLMLLANLYLLWWDFDRLRHLLPGRPPAVNRPPEPWAPRLGPITFGASMVAVVLCAATFYLSLATLGRQAFPTLAGLCLAAALFDLTRGLMARARLS